MGEIGEAWDEIDIEERERQEEEHALSPAGIAEQNDGLLRRYREFRRAADLPLPTGSHDRDGPAV